MGCVQAVQPQFVEKGIWPALMVPSASSAPPFLTLTQNTAQAPTDPTVQFAEDRPLTVSEVRKPTTQLRTQPGAYERHALPVRTLRLLPYRVFEFLQALLSWQTQFVTKAVAQKIEALGAPSVPIMNETTASL